MNPSHAQRNAQLALRLGLAIVFLIFGADKFRAEEAWIAPWTDWMPPWFIKILPVENQTFMYLLGAFEVFVGLSFLTGYFIFWAALSASLFLASLPIFTGLDQYTVRDIGLLGGTISLLLFPGSRRR